MIIQLILEAKIRMMKKPVLFGGYTKEKVLMSEANALDKITAYMAENRINAALEAELEQSMALEAITVEDNDNNSNMVKIPNVAEPQAVASDEVEEKRTPVMQTLDCIYDDEPLGFEKDPQILTKRMQAQDPLEEVDLGYGEIRRPTYISAKIDPSLKNEMVCLLKEFKDCFAWDYNEMSGLSRDLVEHRLPIRPDKRPIKQSPRRFAPEVVLKIKEEIERLLRSKFIRTAMYVDWLANVVPVIKKIGTLRVCIDFRDLNAATPKDEYPMHVADMLVDSAVGHEYLSLLDRKSTRLNSSH